MKNCLVFLTKKYPFDSGEEFIENEISSLARTFDKVILIAVSVSNPDTRTRRVPENVEVHAVPASTIKRGLPLAAAHLFPFGNLNGYCDAGERRVLNGSLKRKLFLTYFIAKSAEITRECGKILKSCRLADYDGVTFYSYWFYDTALTALNLAQTVKAGRVKVVSRAHRYDLYDEQNPAGYLPLRARLLQNMDRVYPCSQDGENYLKSRFPGYTEKISTAYLGTKDFGVNPKRQDGVFRLVSCCHISPVKRVHLLAQSLALLEKSGLNLEWTHFGGGEGLAELKAYAQEHLGFMQCGFPGEIRNPELMKFYQGTPVGCFVNTSSSEGLPVSIMEACSFGIPVIATDVGGNSEIVRDGENGFLLPCDFAPEALAAKLEELCRMPEEKRTELGENSRKLWLGNFNSETNYARFAQDILP